MATTWCGLPPAPPPPMNCGVLLFLHIPKCGGQSVVQYLFERGVVHGWSFRAVRGFAGGMTHPEGYVEIDDLDERFSANAARAGRHNNRTAASAAGERERRMDTWPRLLAQIAAMPQHKLPKFIVEQHTWSSVAESFSERGFHLTLRTLDELLSRRRCQLRLVTMLREPLARTISHANYFRVPHQAFANFVRTAGHNTQTRFVLYNYHTSIGQFPPRLTEQQVIHHGSHSAPSVHCALPLTIAALCACERCRPAMRSSCSTPRSTSLGALNRWMPSYSSSARCSATQAQPQPRPTADEAGRANATGQAPSRAVWRVVRRVAERPRTRSRPSLTSARPRASLRACTI
jgi:hypothetical protein